MIMPELKFGLIIMSIASIISVTLFAMFGGGIK